MPIIAIMAYITGTHPRLMCCIAFYMRDGASKENYRQSIAVCIGVDGVDTTEISLVGNHLEGNGGTLQLKLPKKP